MAQLQLTGTFVGAGNDVTPHAGTLVEVDRDGDRLHLRVPDIGKGTITLDGAYGRGTFRTHRGSEYVLEATVGGADLAYRILSGTREIARGTINGIPP